MPAMITLPNSSRQEVVDYCEENIGCRMYYLHNRIGGDGWSMSRGYPNCVTLEISDPDMELLILLKFGT